MTPGWSCVHFGLALAITSLAHVTASMHQGQKSLGGLQTKARGKIVSNLLLFTMIFFNTSYLSGLFKTFQKGVN